MADTIGTYYFQLAPSTEGISKSISSALGDAGEKSGKSFAGTFGKVMGTTGAVIGTITAAVGGISTALVGATNSVATYGDNIDKMSQKFSANTVTHSCIWKVSSMFLQTQVMNFQFSLMIEGSSIAT